MKGYTPVRSGKHVSKKHGAEICRGNYNGQENDPVWGVFFQGRFYGTADTAKEAMELADKAALGQIQYKW